LPVITPWQLPGTYSGLHLYVIRLDLANISKSQRDVFECLRSDSIGVNLHYIPVYAHPYYADRGVVKGYCPNAELYYASAISLPLYPGLSENMQDSVIAALSKALNR
jgi:dTDP-4-amino-4,6-dideoxygalactose transaminase